MTDEDETGIAGYVLLAIALFMIIYSVWATVQLQSVTGHLNEQLDRTKQVRQDAADIRQEWLKCEAEVRNLLTR